MKGCLVVLQTGCRANSGKTSFVNAITVNEFYRHLVHSALN